MAKASNSQRNNADKSSPLPEKIAVVLQESRWLALVVIAGFLSLALWGYDRVDPGWSHAAQVDGLRNPAGRFGAWLADLLLYLFGVSAWWWVALLLGLVWWGYRRLDGLRGSDRRPLYIAAAGFLVLLVASCGLESLRFYTLRTPLPLVPGGMLGLELGTAAERVLGYTGATMVLLAGVVLGWSLFSGMSWLTAFERLGGSLEMTYGFFLGLVEKWQDRRIGREVAREREAVVEVERARVVHRARAAGLMQQRGVQGVGLSSSADVPGEAALIIFVIKGVSRDPIPPVIDGLRTRVRETARFRAK